MSSFRFPALCAAIITALALPVLADEMPVNLSVFTPISIAKATDSVTGFRFNLIYGKNTSVRIIDLGFVNHTTSGQSKGLGWGFVNYAETLYGVQIGLLNIIKQDGFMPFFPFLNWSF